jgi:hypothetical protein
MNPLHRKQLGIEKPGHRIVQRDIKIKTTETHVTSTYWYDEIDDQGDFVRSHVLEETEVIRKDKHTKPAKTPEADHHDHNRNSGQQGPDDVSANALRAHIRK